MHLFLRVQEYSEDKNNKKKSVFGDLLTTLSTYMNYLPFVLSALKLLFFSKRCKLLLAKLFGVEGETCELEGR